MKKYLMMVFFLACMLIHFENLGQTIDDNKMWVKVFSVRKDGSRIIDNTISLPQNLIYCFNHGVGIEKIQWGSNQINYSFQNYILIINNLNHYNVESLTDSTLVLCDVNNRSLPDENLCRHHFVEINYLLNFLKRNKTLEFENDAIIISNPLLSPYIDLITLIQESTNIYSYGHFELAILLSPNGDVIDCQIYNADKINKKTVDNIIKAMKSSNGKWTLPLVKEKYYFRMKYSITITNSNNSRVVSTLQLFNGQRVIVYKNNANTRQAVKNYNNGVKLYYKGKLEQAKIAFSSAIRFDTLYIDAYYNRAAVNYQLNLLDDACIDWKRLKELGQKEGEALYYENCKK